MKLSWLLIIVLSTALLVSSCGNQQLFVKRKYTRGYYLNLVSDKPQESSNNSGVLNQEPLALTASSEPEEINTILLPKLQKAIIALGDTLKEKKKKARAANQSREEYYKEQYRHPGGNAASKDKYQAPANPQADSDAITGLILGILGIFTFGILSIPAFIYSRRGLQSERYYGFAVAGLTLSLLPLIALIVLIILFFLVLRYGY